MQVRRFARELALLGLSQLPQQPEKLSEQDLDDFLAAAVHTLSHEARESLELATAELERGHDRLLKTELLPEEIRGSDSQRAIAPLKEALTLAQAAINRLGLALDLPEMVQMGNRAEVRKFALQLVRATAGHRSELDELLNESMTGWTVDRLARIDRDLLRLALAEVRYVGTPVKVAVNEAIELSKKYSDADSYRFINGVLRRACGQPAGAS